MTPASSTPLDNRNSLLRSIALGGMIIGIFHLTIQSWLVLSLIQKNPFTLLEQYVASGVLGNAAFEGGIATALLGVFLHFFISFATAGVFILSASRIPLLRRNAIAGSLLYGFGVFVVMYFIVLPLSAAPPLPAPTLPWILEANLEHILLIGLPLGILVRRKAR